MNDNEPPAPMKRILIADDEEAVLQSMKEMLEAYFQVDVAMSAIEVMRLYEQHSYDCLILDVTFEQGLSGLEIASMIRAEDGEVGIVICSAVNYSDDIREQVAEMNAHFLEKPLRLGKVLETLGKH